MFVIGLILLFGQSQLTMILLRITSLLVSVNGLNPDAFYNSYFGVRVAAIVLIISGVVMFYKGRKERSATSTAKQS